MLAGSYSPLPARVFRPGTGRRLPALDPTAGRAVGLHPAGPSEEPWARAPLPGPRLGSRADCTASPLPPGSLWVSPAAVALQESVRLQLVFTESCSACGCVCEGGEFQKLVHVVSSQDYASICGRGCLVSESLPHGLAGCANSILGAVSLSAQRDGPVIITGPLVSAERAVARGPRLT